MGFLVTKKKYYLKREDFSGTDYLQQRFNIAISEEELSSIIRMYDYIKEQDKNVPSEIESLAKKVKQLMEKK